MKWLLNLWFGSSFKMGLTECSNMNIIPSNLPLIDGNAQICNGGVLVNTSSMDYNSSCVTNDYWITANTATMTPFPSAQKQIEGKTWKLKSICRCLIQLGKIDRYIPSSMATISLNSGAQLWNKLAMSNGTFLISNCRGLIARFTRRRLLKHASDKLLPAICCDMYIDCNPVIFYSTDAT